MRVRFFGVRGSVPYATPASIGHGCNTACIEILDESSGRLLVLDAGSGIVGLGETIAAESAGLSIRRDVPILLTHYHWDHVQGLPFFSPLYRSGAAPTVWAPVLGRAVVDLQTIFGAPFSPIPFDRLPSPPAIKTVTTGEITINGFEIGVLKLNHPGGAFAYRIRGAGGHLVYATDHEFGNAEIDTALAAFAANASAVILDAHFTPDETATHVGWGHSDWRQCAAFASACGAMRLWLFHHMPGRSDAALDAIKGEARRLFAATDGRVKATASSSDAGSGRLIDSHCIEHCRADHCASSPAR
jgi:phosphoribosyl 1,2-cyclic phosphodiesterase